MKLTIEQIQLYNQLPPKEQIFAMAVIDGKTPANAFKKATGTSDPLTAMQWMDQPRIAKFISCVQLSELDSRVMLRDEALRNLSAIARGAITDVMDFQTHQVADPLGNPTEYVRFNIKDLSKVDPIKAGLVESIAETKDGVKLKMHSKLAALGQLRAMCGWDAVDETLLDVLKNDPPLVQISYVKAPPHDPTQY